MINPGYKISANDVKQLKDFKKSEAYSTYLKGISLSPAFIAIMDEHINNVDISKDVDQLKHEGKLPSSIGSKNITALFKQTLCRMAIGILADSIILKELEDCKVEEILGDLKKDSDVTYLLGQAEHKYYVRAAQLLEEGKLDDQSLAFRGLMAYMKLHKDEFKKPQEACSNLIEEPSSTVFDGASTVSSKKKSSINLDDDEISL